MEKKGIKNADTVACKLGPASTRATDDKLDAAKEKKRKKEEMIERWKAEAIAVKQYRARGRMSLFSEEEDESDTKNDTNPNQTNN